MIRRAAIRLLILLFAVMGLVGTALGQIPLDSPHGPMAAMIDPVSKQQVAVSPSFTRVNVVITDAIAQVVVTQRFVNPGLRIPSRTPGGGNGTVDMGRPRCERPGFGPAAAI